MSAGTLSFDEYWVAFVRAHASPSLRRLSFASTSAAIGTATAFLLTRRSVFLVLSPLVAFVPPWVARKLSGETAELHGHPLFYAAANLKLWQMTLTGAMEAEVGRIISSSSPFEPFEGDELPRPNMVTDHTLH